MKPPKIRTKPLRGAPRLFVYGPHGIGKTTFANEAGCLIQPTEDGTGEIAPKVGILDVARTVDEVFEVLDWLINGSHKYRGYALDTIDWFEKLVFKSICEKSGKGNIAEACGGYGKGYIEALNLFFELFDRLEILNKKRGMLILLLGHARIETFKDPFGEPFDRYIPDLFQGKTVQIGSKTIEWCDAVLFANFEQYTAKRKTDEDSCVALRGECRRKLYCSKQAAFEEKNRFNLPSELAFSWSELVSNIVKGREENDS